MCRLLAVKTTQPVSVASHLSTFATLCKQSKEYQGHGWGIAYLNSTSEWKYYKNINPIWEERASFSSFGTSRLFLVHARSAFQDKDIVIENNMPFYDDRFIFTFNGELRGVRLQMPGRIGAEKIFNGVKQNYHENLKGALEHSMKTIVQRTRYVRAMNIIMLEKPETIAVSTLFNEDPAYFTMHMKQTPSELIICSEQYPNETGWIAIHNTTVQVFS